MARSFRESSNNLGMLNKTGESSMVNQFKLKNACSRLCYHDDKIWCICDNVQQIDIYNLAGAHVRTIKCKGLNPQSLHPMESGEMLVASKTGLIKMDIRSTSSYTCILDGNVLDVHVNVDNVVALVENEVYTFQIIDGKLIETGSFKTEGKSAKTVLVSQDLIYVSFIDDKEQGKNASIKTYDYEGKMCREYVIPMEMGSLKCSPILCAINQDINTLILCDKIKGVKLLKLDVKDNVFKNIEAVDIKYPQDIIIIDHNAYILGEQTIFKIDA